MSTIDSEKVKDVWAAGGPTRTSVAHDAHGRALERVEDLGAQLRSAFDELYRASEQMKEVGVDVGVKLHHPIDEAWAAWRAKRVLKDGKR